VRRRIGGDVVTTTTTTIKTEARQYRSVAFRVTSCR
jgi:hypothetical protein